MAAGGHLNSRHNPLKRKHLWSGRTTSSTLAFGITSCPIRREPPLTAVHINLRGSSPTQHSRELLLACQRSFSASNAPDQRLKAGE